MDSSKIKVLHVIKTLDLGGAEANLLNLLKASAGTENHVAYSRGGAFEEEFKKSGARLHKYAAREERVQSLATPGIVADLCRYIRRLAIDVVHTHTYNAQVWGALAARFAGVRLVEHVHDFRYEEREYLASRRVRPGQFKTAVFFARFSDRIVVLTENNKKFLLKRGVPSPKVIVRGNGIPLDVPVFRDAGRYEALSLPRDKKMILMAARFSAEKNVELVPEIARRVKTKDALFVLAGDGPGREPLERKIRASGLSDRVRLVGFFPDVRLLLSKAHLLLQPTLLELHSITMLEAMSMRVPVLVSKGVGCNDEFLKDGVNGRLLDPFSPEPWAAAIDELFADEARRKSMGDAGRRLVENTCNIRGTAKFFEEMYRHLMKLPPTPSLKKEGESVKI